MRAMAWERAKGEIKSMLTTYYCREDGDKFKEMQREFEAFVAAVEDNALHE
jgi:hypothetical protein